MSPLPSATHLYIGTYTRTTSKGVYRIPFDAATGALGSPGLVAEAKNPTWLAPSPDRRSLYITDAGLEGVKAYAVNPDDGSLVFLNQQSSGAGHPTHLVVDATGRMAISANYGSGSVSSWPVLSDGSLGPVRPPIRHTGSSVNPERQKEPHAHGVTLSPDNRFAFVPDLGTDRIMAYVLDHASAGLSPHTPAFASVPPGSGPRHLSFSPDGRHAYVINEMGGTISVFSYDPAAGALAPIETVSTLPAGFAGTNKTAEVVVHPSGHYVYGSNRGHDSIAVFARDAASGQLSLVEIVSSGGKSPRHFELSPDGRWLISVHEDSHDGFVFAVDAKTGRLTRTAHGLAVPQPVCVLFASN